MMRTCNGTDPNLLDAAIPNAGPCACGLAFDDAERDVIYPHAFLMTAADRARLAAWIDSISVEDLVTRTPARLYDDVTAVLGR